MTAVHSISMVCYVAEKFITAAIVVIVVIVVIWAHIILMTELDMRVILCKGGRIDELSVSLARSF